MIFNNKKSRQEFWKLLLATQTAEDIENALNALDEESSRIIQFHYLMKYPLKDIAPILNRSVGYVRQKNNKAIRQLRVHFGM